MKNVPLLIGTLAVTIIFIVGAAMLFSTTDKTVVADTGLIRGKTQNVVGPANAKVTVIEFGDFQCPACGATEPIVQQLRTQHKNDVLFVFRHFPLTEIHKNAQQAAQTAEAAARLGKFWEMHDMLYATQNDWSDLDANGAKAKFAEYVDKLQIDKNEFQKRIDSQEVRDQITQDVADGTKAGVDGTPTFYVNGQKTPAPQLISTVESMLAQSK